MSNQISNRTTAASPGMADNVNEGPATEKLKSRLNWVDCAKGLCIILVVMLHSTKGVEQSLEREGLIHYFVSFAQPFRMPDFFLISGLFLSRVIKRDWLSYLDTKVLHFAYFYVLWVTINFALKSPGLVNEVGYIETISLYLQAFIQPLGTLWFIYLLPFFFVATKLLRKINPLFVFAVAAALEIATIHTGWIVIDQFAERFVYFFAGYWLANHVFNLATFVQRKRKIATAGVVVWAVVNATFVFSGLSKLPFLSLVMGIMGAAAVVTIAALISTVKLSRPIRYCGKNSIVIYLAFFLSMYTTRTILVETGIFNQVSVISFFVTLAGVIGPLVLWKLIRNTKLSFLFIRPKYFTLTRPAAKIETIIAAPVVREGEALPDIELNLKPVAA